MNRFEEAFRNKINLGYFCSTQIILGRIIRILIRIIFTFSDPKYFWGQIFYLE
jgi:hypothetical protein